MKIVTNIITDVKENGDSAILKYSLQYDKNNRSTFELSRKEIDQAYSKVGKDIINAIDYSIQNVREFAEAQLSQLKEFSLERPYGIIGQKIIPLEKVGCYVPGGKFPLLSSAIMSVVPANVVGVNEIIVSSPNIKPEVIVAADLAGADRIFNVGGVQAIAAMAYGTCQIPKVDKIVGPGNKYVTYAKRLCFGDVGIDMCAGPSEILVISDGTVDSELIKADLEAQKEHDTEAKIWLLTVESEVDMAKVIKKTNEISPEHLVLFVKDSMPYIAGLKNFGSLFIGPMSGVVFGDYCSGTNHILPTQGSARYRGGLSVFDFVKIITYQKLEYDEKMIEVASLLAESEGLEAHKKSAEIRKIYK
tara:strand:- start:6943 stop:8022 length:1080 start_codon:yes stop_codon:yes gene_type:complete